MADWNPLLYLKFSGERTRPAEDLAGSLPLRAPARVLDIGCGPGNSTAVLSRRFPAAELLGVDASPAMVRQAQAAFPQWQFRVCTPPEGLRALDGGWDVVFSNACLQWVPGHRQLIPALFGLRSQGGVLAVQVPRQDRQPVHRLLKQLALSPRWRGKIRRPRAFYNLAPKEYFILLGGLTPEFRMWETTYYQTMESHAAMLDWYRSTGLRPYLAQLCPTDARLFEADVLAGLRRLYPSGAGGQILFPFPRLFFTAVKH